ncbi:MAG TPA: DUF4097 family beta strand repeat-containing protein [Gemmatimonadaceae bacterium]|nr:DUF4097 family beta strand repeat-containing protein [Gemmatimonadaceae bacterium]
MPRTLIIRRFAPPTLFVAAAAATLGLAPRSAAAQDRPITSIDTTVAFARGGVVDLSVVSGEIRVVGWARSEVRINASTEEGELRFESSPSRVAIEQLLRGRGRHHGDADARYELSVPVGTRLLMRSTSGDLSAKGIKGDVEARTVSGGVEVEDGGGHTEIESVSGDVRGARLGGDVRAHSVSGEVEVSDVAGDADAESVSGSITISGAHSKVARAETVSGDVRYDGSIDASGHYEFHSHSGDVELRLPANASASVSIETFSGEITSDFPLMLRPETESGRPRRARQLEFTLGGGGPRIDAKTFSGDVVIRRAGGSGGKAESTRRNPPKRDRDQDDDDDDEPHD